MRQADMFGIGIILIVIGTRLIALVNVQRRAHAGLIKESTDLINAFAN